MSSPSEVKSLLSHEVVVCGSLDATGTGADVRPLNIDTMPSISFEWG